MSKIILINYHVNEALTIFQNLELVPFLSGKLINFPSDTWDFLLIKILQGTFVSHHWQDHLLCSSQGCREHGITDWVQSHHSYFKGYQWIDCPPLFSLFASFGPSISIYNLIAKCYPKPRILCQIHYFMHYSLQSKIKSNNRSFPFVAHSYLCNECSCLVQEQTQRNYQNNFSVFKGRLSNLMSLGCRNVTHTWRSLWSCGGPVLHWK